MLADKTHLVNLAEYLELKPFTQGYVAYMQAELPYSELKTHQHNPYQPGTVNAKQWDRGQRVAVLEVQDLEE